MKIPDTPEELLRQGRKNMQHINQWIPFLFIAGIVLAVVLSSFYQVNTDEVGVVRRFGKFARITSSGLHWKLPLNIEKVDRVKVKKNYKEEFGFRTIQGGVRTQYSSRSYTDESLMLTGDLNVLEVQWSVQFNIKDPKAILFNIRDPRETLRDLSETVMRQVVGDYSVSEAINTNTKEISDLAKVKLQEILDDYDAGILVTNVEMTYVYVPDEVKPSFDAVNQAEQEKEKIKNQALQAYNKVMPKARGEAEKTIQEAEGYLLRRVNEAKGDASKFVDTWEAYKTAKDVTRKRIYLETLGEVLPKVGKTFVLDKNNSNVLPLLNLTEGLK